MGASIVYPSGPVPPHGVYHLIHGDRPEVSLQSYNDNIVFHLMGGRSIVDRTRPESVQLVDLKGLIPPWETIDVQGATEDGVTFVDGLYGPMEVTAKVVARARDAKHLRRVVRHLIESLDLHQCSELSFITRELGHWWAPVRWFKTPAEGYSGKSNRQEMTLVLRADSAFWQSYPDVDSFEFQYDAMTDTFTENRGPWRDLGENWPQYYDGDGGGYMYSDGNRAIWRDDPDDVFITKSAWVVNGPYKDFDTDTDNQVVSCVLGSVPEQTLPKSGQNDLWARMGRDIDGNWDGSGIRGRFTRGRIELSAWIDFEMQWERVVRKPLMLPFLGDKWQLVAGYDGDPRMFRIFRNGGEMLAYKEPAAVSLIGAGQRGVGFGAYAGASLITQATPSSVRKVSAGDNAEITQTGFLKRRNAGDQPAYDEYTLYGPATKFTIANGPDSTDMVEFGPVEAGKIVHIRTDPRRRGVFDLTNVSTDTTPYLFGAQPSDDLYRRMNGRFWQNQIPAKQPGMRVATHTVACGIAGGNADSKIVASLTPLRRYPS